MYSARDHKWRITVLRIWNKIITQWFDCHIYTTVQNCVVNYIEFGNQNLVLSTSGACLQSVPKVC
jgi:hypothetical protein